MKTSGTNLKGIPPESGLPKQGFGVVDLEGLRREKTEGALATADLKPKRKKPEGGTRGAERQG